MDSLVPYFEGMHNAYLPNRYYTVRNRFYHKYLSMLLCDLCCSLYVDYQWYYSIGFPFEEEELSKIINYYGPDCLYSFNYVIDCRAVLHLQELFIHLYHQKGFHMD